MLTIINQQTSWAFCELCVNLGIMGSNDIDNNSSNISDINIYSACTVCQTLC